MVHLPRVGGGYTHHGREEAYSTMVLGRRHTHHGTREAVYPPWYTHTGRQGAHTAWYTHREAGRAYTQGVYTRGVPMRRVRFTVGQESRPLPEPLSELKPEIIKTGQKTLEWSTNLNVLFVLTVLRISGYSGFLVIPGFREPDLTTF